MQPYEQAAAAVLVVRLRQEGARLSRMAVSETTPGRAARWERMSAQHWRAADWLSARFRLGSLDLVLASIDLVQDALAAECTPAHAGNRDARATAATLASMTRHLQPRVTRVPGAAVPYMDEDALTPAGAPHAD